MGAPPPLSRRADPRRPHPVDSWSEFDYQPPASPRRHRSDEELLLVAVLHRGLLDYAILSAFLAGEGRAPRDMHELDDAVRWVKSRDIHPFSFEFCCWQGLGQDPEIIRNAIEKNWRRFLCRDAAMIFHVENTSC